MAAVFLSKELPHPTFVSAAGFGLHLSTTLKTSINHRWNDVAMQPSVLSHSPQYCHAALSTVTQPSVLSHSPQYCHTALHTFALLTQPCWQSIVIFLQIFDVSLGQFYGLVKRTSSCLQISFVSNKRLNLKLKETNTISLCSTYL